MLKEFLLIWGDFSRKAFGELEWKKPAWTQSTGPQLKFYKERVLQWIRNNPKKSKQYGGGITLAVLLIVAGYQWYKSLPEVHYVSVSIQVPVPQRLEENSKPNPLEISFSESVAPLTSVGKTVTEGIKMLPAQKGFWRWESDKLLSFIPDVDWLINQNFDIRVDKKFLASHIKLQDYTLHFTSAAFVASLTRNEFYINPQNPKEKRGAFYLRFSHPIDLQSLRDHIELTIEDKNAGILNSGKKSLGFDVSQDTFGGTASIVSEEVGIPEQDSIMTLKLSKGVKSTRGGAGFDAEIASSLAVPGMYNFFRIQNVHPTLVRNDKFEPEQVLLIESTADARSESIANGLEVFVLPEEKPADGDEPAKKRYHWTSASEVTPKIATLMKKLPLELIPTEHEGSKLHSFRFKTEVGRFLLIKIKKGIKSYGDYILSNEYNSVTQVPPFPRELLIMHSGSVLSLSGEKKLSILTRNVEALRYEVSRVIPSEIAHLVSQNEGNFKNPSFSGYNFNEENITERFEEIETIPVVDKAATNYSAIDLSKYLAQDGGSKRGLFFLKVNSWNVKQKSVSGLSDRRLILVTDLGLLAKKNSNGSWSVFVQSLGTGRPVSGASVEVLARNGTTNMNRSTGEDGKVEFPDLNDFTREKAPIAFVVKHNGDLSYLPIQRNYDRTLNYSRFDIGGVHVSPSEDRLTAFVFSDRGIYRPGDTLNAAFIVKASTWNRSVTGVPVELTLQDPKGVEVLKEKRSLNQLGFDELSYQSTDNAPTGTYRASVYLIKDGYRDVVLGSTTLKIEEFLPDRMKITTHLSEERAEGWVNPVGLTGRVSLKNLFGTPAQNRRIAASIRLSPIVPSFKKYADFMFSDPKKMEKSIEETLESKTTDDAGLAEFDLNLERFEKATYRLFFSAEGFESEGGRGVHSDSSVLVSPLDYLVGYKTDGALNYIAKNALRKVEWIAVNSQLEKIKSSQLKLQLVEIKWVSVLSRQNNGLYKYESVQKENILSEKPLTIAAAGIQVPLPTDKPGDFTYILRDAENTELSRVTYSVVGKANLARGLDRTAELQVTLNRSDYNSGDEIQVSIKAPYTGAGLITIERDSVYTHKWFNADTASSVQTIRIPAGLEGNAYVNVSFVRALNSEEIFMSPLSYGIAPFSISREGRTNRISLNSPDKIKPGEKMKIRYQTTKPGKAVIFAVDEGILQVANYKTPDPLSFFLSKKALQVNTMQILDLLLPEFSIVKSLRSGAGGDDGSTALGQNLNPFKRKNEKPVAYWSGIVDSGTTEKSVEFEVPDYFNGSVRVMGLVVSSDSLGAAERKSLVRGDFVLSPNLPTFVAPNDEFEVTLGVSNNAEKSGTDTEITVNLELPPSLTMLGEKSQKIKIKEGFEDVVKFRLKASDQLGPAALKFSAQAGRWNAHYKSELSLRPANPYITELRSEVLHDSTKTWDITRNMFANYRDLEVSLSPLPLGLAHGLLGFLDNYAYGCTEQLVSKAFAAIVLAKHPEFGANTKDSSEKLTKLIHVLRSRQDPYGGFGYWNGNSIAGLPFHTLYALHFLTEVKDMGFTVPKDMLDRGLEFLKGPEISKASNLSEARLWAYSLYILARNGRVMNNEASLLRKTLEKQYKNQWEKDVVALYLGATYSLYKKEDEARKIFFKAKLGDPLQNNSQWWEQDSLRESSLIYLAAKHFPAYLSEVSGKDIEKMFKQIFNGKYNTLNSAFAIMAASAYSDYVQKAGAINSWRLSLQEFDAQGQAKAMVIPGGFFPKLKISASSKKIKLSSDSNLPIFVQIKEAGFDRESPTTAKNSGLEMTREYLDEEGKVVSSIELGKELNVRLRGRSLSPSAINDLAIVDLLPGGFEPVLETRVASNTTPTEEYMGGEDEGVYHEEENNQNPSVQEDEGYLEEGAFLKALFPLNVAWAQTLSTTGASLSALAVSYLDMREDRVLVFGSLGADAREFQYKIKAVNRGSYSVPPVFAESMYDRQIQSRGAGAKITIE